MSNILIEASNISKIYDPDIFLIRGKNYYALDNVNFILEKGDFTCIMGPSGSGKSTLLNCLSTLDTISRGTVYLKGTALQSLSKDQLCEFRYKTLGFIFQNHNLIPYLSIYDNIATPAMLGEQKSEEINNKIIKLAQDLEIEKILDKFPDECSGGECQRAAIARALINDPEIIFCDEPTGNLDSKNSHKVLSILSQLNQKGTTILLVTHDAMIASYAKTLMYLYDGQVKTVVHRNNSHQMDFYHKINDIVTQDSLLKEIVGDKVIVEVKNESKDTEIETVKVENKDITFTSRQDVYMYIDGTSYNKDALKRNTPFEIKEHQVFYRNKHNKDMSFDLSSIQEINIDLKAYFSGAGMFSQFLFDVYVDFVSDKGTYKFKSKNKDDFIIILNYFKELNIPINDPRDIIGTYHKYPRDLERHKYYQRTHKDLTKPGAYDRVNYYTGKKL